jgi:formylglycine-generating enzyme required for sulfatase activity
MRVKEAFWIGRSEVTMRQFRRFVEESGYVTDAEKPGGAPHVFDPGWTGYRFSGTVVQPWRATEGKSWRDPGFPHPLREDFPVVCVSWNDARAFGEWLTKREREAGRLPEGLVYRLPTEAEWEYACRAGSAGAWCFGDEMAVFGDYGCFAKNSGGRTSPVGQRKPNAWGIHDMHGNIWEWCQDWYETYASNPATDPSGPGEGSYRVYRGGGWGDPAGFCRSAVRGFYVPAFRFDGLGFRLAMSSPS